MIGLKREPGIVFLLLLFFCFSLDVQAPISFYGTQFVGLSVLVFVRFLIYPKISLKCMKLFFFTVIFLEILCFFQNIYIQKEILVLVYQKVVFLLSVVILLYDFLIKVKQETLKKSIAIYISFMASVVLFQFVGFYFLHIDRSLLDLGLLLGGTESRTWYYGDWLYRPTGITSEPAIFIGVQFGLLTLQYLVDKEAKFTRIFGVLSLALSMSFLGLILSALYLVIVYSKNIKNYLMGLLLLCVFYIFSFEMINTRVEKFTNGEDGSNNVKIEAFNYFLSDPNITFFGYGFLFPSEGSPQFYDALLDLTFYLNTISIFGVFLGCCILFMFFYYIIKSNSSLKEKLLICLALVKLSNPSVLFFSCFLVFVFAILKYRVIDK